MRRISKNKEGNIEMIRKKKGNDWMNRVNELTNHITIVAFCETEQQYDIQSEVRSGLSIPLFYSFLSDIL